MSTPTPDCPMCGKPLRTVGISHLVCSTLYVKKFERKHPCFNYMAQGQVFTWLDPDNAAVWAFDVQGLQDALEANLLSFSTFNVPIDFEWARTWLPKRITDETLCQTMPDDRRREPILAVWLTAKGIKGQVLIIDGSHRYMANVLAGAKSIWHNVVHFPDWQAFAFQDQELLGLCL